MTGHRGFHIGNTIVRREVLLGRPWLEQPVTVVADEDILAVLVSSGAALNFPEHPTPHP